MGARKHGSLDLLGGVFLLICLLLGGLYVVTTGPPTTTDTGDGHGLVPGEGTSSFQRPRMNSTNGPFQLNSRYAWRLIPSTSTTFQDVMLCAYDRDGMVLYAENLGTFSTPDEFRNVSLTLEQPPAVILVDHPRFHEYDELGLTVLRRRADGGYSMRQFAPQDLNGTLSFPYPRRDRPGECM
jgi:hypothetical protein